MMAASTAWNFIGDDGVGRWQTRLQAEHTSAADDAVTWRDAGKKFQCLQVESFGSIKSN